MRKGGGVRYSFSPPTTFSPYEVRKSRIGAAGVNAGTTRSGLCELRASTEKDPVATAMVFAPARPPVGDISGGVPYDENLLGSEGSNQFRSSACGNLDQFGTVFCIGAVTSEREVGAQTGTVQLHSCAFLDISGGHANQESRVLSQVYNQLARAWQHAESLTGLNLFLQKYQVGGQKIRSRVQFQPPAIQYLTYYVRVCPTPDLDLLHAIVEVIEKLERAVQSTGSGATREEKRSVDIEEDQPHRKIIASRTGWPFAR